MLFFLRKIRRKLMQNSKFTTYLLYAIGEIVLVVIGILIAVSLNNWNERIKYKTLEKDLISDLNSEFKENLEILTDREKTNDSVIIYMSNILSAMNETLNQSFTSDEIDSILYHSIHAVTWYPSDYALKKVGTLNSKGNGELLTLLYDWSRTMENNKKLEKNSTNAILKMIEYIKLNGSLRQLDIYGNHLLEGRSIINNSNLHLLKDPVFENIVDDAIVYTRQKNEGYIQSIQKMNRIIEITNPK